MKRVLGTVLFAVCACALLVLESFSTPAGSAPFAEPTGDPTRFDLLVRTR